MQAKYTATNNGVAHYQINRFVSEKKNRMWLYDTYNFSMNSNQTNFVFTKHNKENLHKLSSTINLLETVMKPRLSR